MIHNTRKDIGEVLSAPLVTIMRNIALTVAILIAVTGCDGESGRAVEFYDLVDLQPPKLEGVHVHTANNIELCLDEKVSVIDQSLQLSAPLTLEKYDESECGVILTIREKMTPGSRYTISMTVVDENGNSLDIITNVYGYNDRVPEIVINEFTTRGSKSHPDIVELYLQSGGNIGGVTLYEGSATNWQSREVFPSLELEAGSYILVHLKPQGTTEAGEQDETASASASGGFDAHETAWDFWVEGGDGLSGNNGALTLTTAPNGEIMDAILYTNRNSKSDSKYRGFGTAQNLGWAEELHDANQWNAAEASLRPEDVVFVGYSTATRSVCRGSGSLDSNSKGDWHTVPTSGYSFGKQNSDDVHER